MAAQEAFLEQWSREGGEFPRFRLGLKGHEFKDWPDKVLATKDLPKDLVKVKDECTGKACKFFAACYCKKGDYCRYSNDIEVCACAFPKKQKKPNTKALHMAVLGQDHFMSK